MVPKAEVTEVRRSPHEAPHEPCRDRCERIHPPSEVYDDDGKAFDDCVDTCEPTRSNIDDHCMPFDPIDLCKEVECRAMEGETEPHNCIM